MMQENAVLKYPKNFDKDRRSLDFEGVAYFDVARDEAKPFVIHCGNMAVEVLGTSFDLSACKDESEYELNLVSGKVSMTSFDENGGILDQAVLYPGERGVFSVSDGNLHRLNKMEVLRADAIENHVLDFNNAKLSEVIESLRFIYDLDIDLDENCADYRLTARLDGESVESVLETIAAVFGLQVVNDGTTILIK
jgi:Fe2+-dicitrate sensor, membrane component